MTKNSAPLTILLLLTITALTVGLVKHFGTRNSQAIKIGAVLELTGDVSAYGRAAMNGIEMAVEDLNTEHYLGERECRVFFEDSQSEARAALAAFDRLVTTHAVPVVIGGISSSTTLAMAPAADRDHVVLFSPGASNPKLTTAGPYVFRNYPSDLLEAKPMVDYIASQGFKHVAIIYEISDYSAGLANAFAESWKKQGNMIVFSEGYETDATDFRTLIQKALSVHPDALYFPGYYRGVGLLLRQLRERGVTLPVFSSTGIEDPKFFEIAGQAGDGVVYPTPSIDFQNPPPNAREFIAHYRSKYKEDPNYPALLAYDAMKIIALAIHENGDSPEEIRSALHRIKDFPGLTGLTTIDENGDAEKPFGFKMANQGQFRLLTPPGNGHSSIVR